MVWRGLPVERPDRVVAFKTIDDTPLSASFREIEDWRAATTTFAGIAAYMWQLTIDGQPPAGDDLPRNVSFVTI